MATKRSRSRRRRKKQTQLAVLTCVLLSMAALAAVLLTPAFHVTTVNIEGNALVGDEDILISSGVVLGTSMFSVNLDAVKAGIEAMPNIEEATVKRQFPHTINITVSEGLTAAYIETPGGYIGITASGRALEFLTKYQMDTAALPTEPVTETDEEDDEESDEDTTEDTTQGMNRFVPSEKPVIRGMEGTKYAIGRTVAVEDPRKLELLCMYLEEFMERDLLFHIAVIDLTYADDMSFYYNDGTLKVRFGGPDNLDYKLTAFESGLSEIGDRGGLYDLVRSTYRESIV